MTRAQARLRMTLDDATLDKWQQGQFEYGDDDEWHGDHPIIEANEEMLDLFNYFNRARRLVPTQWCSEDRIRRINKLVARLADELALAVKEAGLLP